MWDFVSWPGCVSNTRVWLHFQTPRNSEKSSVSSCVCFISYNSDYLVHLLLSFITGITTKPEHELTFDTANSSLIPHNEFYKRRCFASTGPSKTFDLWYISLPFQFLTKKITLVKIIFNFFGIQITIDKFHKHLVFQFHELKQQLSASNI